MNLPNANFDTPGDCRFSLHRDAWGRLVLTEAAGRQHVDVEPVRCFPISSPEQWVSICDAVGHEIACVHKLESLPPPVRQILEEELARREFVPIVERIVKVLEDAEFCVWRVETDRGPTWFRTNTEDAVRRLDAKRALIVDATGIRYLIPNTAALDGASRRILDRYL